MKYLLLLSLFFSISLSAQTFSSIINQPVPDDGTEIAFDITVNGLPVVVDTTFGIEQICFSMTHTWDDDMEIKLKSPDGTIVSLFSHVGGDGDDFTNTCLNMTAPVTLSSGAAPFTGTYKAQGDMGGFNNGQNPNGVWQLILHDTYPFADQGFFIGWNITFSNHPAIPFSFSSSNLPLVIIHTNGQTILNEPKIESSFEIIDNGPGNRNHINDTTFAYSGKMMVELQGFSGPSYPKKNYDFDLIDTAGDKIDTTLLGLPAENDWILKAEYLDVSLMANPLTYEMSRRMGMYAPRTKYCEVVINGEYMGVYSLTEKVKRGNNRLDIAKLSQEDTTGNELTGGYIIEMNINGDPAGWNSVYPPINNATCNFPVEFKNVYPKSNEIQPQQFNYIKTFVDSFEVALQNDSADPNTWREMASEKSFINFQIVNEFSANYDSYGRSTYMYKEKVTDGNKLHIGPPWDYDRAYAAGTETGWVWLNTHPYWPFPFWWSKLNNDTTYLRKLYCRWTSLRMHTLSNDSFYAFIDSTASLLAEAAQRNFFKWGELGVDSYSTAVTRFRSYVTDRLAWMDANILPNGETVPSVYLADTTLCKGGVISIDSSLNLSYKWSTGDSSTTLVINQAGQYSITVKDAYGCFSMAAAQIHVSEPNAYFVSQIDSGKTFWFSPVDTGLIIYNWQFGDDSVSSSVSPYHVYDTAGMYAVTLMVTDSIGCKAYANDTVTFNPPVILAMQDEILTSTRVLPNPFSDFIYVYQPEGASEGMITIKDITGRLVFNSIIMSNTMVIPTSYFKPGIYLLSIANPHGYKQAEKLVKY